MIAPEGLMPVRATNGSAGYDIFCPDDIDITPGKWQVIDTGVRLDGTERLLLDGIPVEQWYMKIVPKSGLGFKCMTRLANTEGVVDRDYRDTIKVKITSEKPLHLNKGDKFVQAIFEPYLILLGEEKPGKERTGGFGSTGATR